MIAKEVLKSAGFRRVFLDGGLWKQGRVLIQLNGDGTFTHFEHLSRESDREINTRPEQELEGYLQSLDVLR